MKSGESRRQTQSFIPRRLCPTVRQREPQGHALSQAQSCLGPVSLNLTCPKAVSILERLPPSLPVRGARRDCCLVSRLRPQVVQHPLAISDPAGRTSSKPATAL